MFVDDMLVLSDGQDLAQTAGDYYSTNVLNTGSLIADIGAGNPLYLICCVDEAFVGASGTVKISLIDEADTTLDSGSVEIVSTDTIAITRLTLGKIIVLPIPTGLITQQYLGVRYDIGTTTQTAGTITAFIGIGAQTWNKT